MAAKGAAGGFVVTSGSFTEEAIEFASGRNVTLIDGSRLFGLIQQAKAARGGQGKAEAAPVQRPLAPFAALASAAAAATTCPICSGSMVRRVAKRGDKAGNAFWGCSNYPSCRGTRSIDA